MVTGVDDDKRANPPEGQVLMRGALKEDTDVVTVETGIFLMVVPVVVDSPVVAEVAPEVVTATICTDEATTLAVET